VIAREMASAMKACDFETLNGLLADDVVIRSPITSSFVFEGRARVLGLLRMVRDAYEELEYTDFVGEGDTQLQVFTARVDGSELEGADLIRLDSEGRILEFTVFFRPLPGLAALAAVLAPRLAGERGRGRAVIARAGTRPIAVATRMADRVGARLVG
jgi:SnoaL-like protein